MNYAEQRVLTDGLAQKSHCTGSQGPFFLFLGSLSAKENHWSALRVCPKATRQLQAVHTGHSHINNQAGCLDCALGAE
jgi:hypothetical protein